jgi:hypothetical protein
MFCLLPSIDMKTWQQDWRDARVDRLEKRVYAIEEGMRKPKQRSFERILYAMLALVWILAIASVVLGIVERGSP